MIRKLLAGLLLMLLPAYAQAQRVISDYSPAPSINLGDKLLLQQGPRTTPYTYGTPAQLQTLFQAQPWTFGATGTGLAVTNNETVGGTLTVGGTIATVPPATGVASTDTTNLQTAATAAAGGMMIIPAGTYAQNTPVTIFSGTHVLCARGAILQASATWVGSVFFLLTNQHNTDGQGVLTDHDITIQGCTLDVGTNRPTSFQFHAIHMEWASRIRVRDVYCFGGGDCTAMVADQDTVVEASTSVGTGNACWDHWFHPADGVVVNSYCQPNATQGGCVLYNGPENGGDNSSTTGGYFSGLTCTGLSAGQAGIWIGSIAGVPSGSGGHGAVVTHNYIDGGSNAVNACIKNEGAEVGTIIDGNTCINASATATSGIADITDTGGTPTDTVISNNVMTNWGSAGSVFWTDGARTKIRSNRVGTATFAFDVRLNGNQDSSVDNYWPAGGSGTYNLSSGTNYVIKDLFQSAPQTPSSCGTSPTFSTSSNDRAWTLNVGSGGPVTACNFSFRVAFALTPTCVVTSDLAGANPSISAITTTSITIATASDVTGKHLYGVCQQPGS